MGITSKIEWTDATWNPWQGCTKVSPACANCYMFTDLKRYGRDGSLVVRSKPPTFNLPLKRRQTGEYAIAPGSKVFTCSWSDWFHERADAWRSEAWAIIRQRPDVTFQIVTKRTDRILGCLPGDWGQGYPNVWLIATVENQEWADRRVPELLNVPARVRGLSIEPLLGRIDLEGWGDHAPSADWESLPATWSEFVWPDWVPLDQRKQIENFWGASYGRSPREWARDNFIQRMPATGARVRFGKYGHWLDINKMPVKGEAVEGRYLHSWNNVGRVVTDDGQVYAASGSGGSGWLSQWLTKWGDYKHKLHWVIVGGESGPNARPMYLDWVRGLRDQCAERKIAFHFKQWGEWSPINETERTAPRNSWGMYRVGKTASGRLLDGRTHDEFPFLLHQEA